MNYEEREERLFMLRLFKFGYNMVSVFLPPDLQKEYDKFPEGESSYFTEKINKAVLILMNEKYDDIDDIPEIGSEDFNRIANELANDYNPLDFLKFCSWFVIKAASGCHGESFNSYQTVWSALENIFQRGRGRDGFNVVTWETLDKAASFIIQKDDENYQRDPDYNPYAELNLEKEMAFVLRVMQFVFRLHDHELPEYYMENEQILDEQDYQLSDEVRSALRCIQNVLRLPEKRVGAVGLRNHYCRMSFYPFKGKEFLEYCYVFSRKALLDYYDFDIANTPARVFETCVNILRDVREKGLCTPWGKIEDAAMDIIEDHLARLADERFQEQRLRDLTKESRRRFYDILRAQFGNIDPPEWETDDAGNWIERPPVEISELVQSINLESVETGESSEMKNLESVETDEQCEMKKRKLTTMDEPEEKKIRETSTTDEPSNNVKPISGELNRQESVETDESESDDTENSECFEKDERKQSEIVKAGQEKIENKFDHINCSCCKCS